MRTRPRIRVTNFCELDNPDRLIQAGTAAPVMKCSPISAARDPSPSEYGVADHVGNFVN
jgi:hypothetical protein